MKDPLTPEDKALWRLFSEGIDRLKKSKEEFVVLPLPSPLPPLKKRSPFNSPLRYSRLGLLQYNGASGSLLSTYPHASRP